MLTVLLSATSAVLAQAPAISYQSPQAYKRFQSIAPLQPANTGGLVPAESYGEVSTFSGIVGDHSDKDGPIGSATYYGIGDMVTGSDGTVYIADAGNNQIRVLTTTGSVYRFAGGDYKGNADGLRLNALFFNPRSIAITTGDVLFIGDYYNYQLRKISNGTVSTFVPHGVTPSVNSYAGVTVDAQGNIFFTEDLNNRIGKVTMNGIVTVFAGNGVSGAADGLGNAATFNNPVGIVADKTGNLYVADYLNNRIRKITAAGLVSTFAGDGQALSKDGLGTAASINGPGRITFDASGNLIVSESNGNKIRLIKPDGTVTTIAGNGATGAINGVGQTATFNYPQGITIDKQGNLLVGDLYNSVIRKVILNGYTIDKALPPGLIFDSKTGIISGTPSTPWPATVYTITAHNANGSAVATVNLKVDDVTTPVTLPPNITYPTPKVYYVTLPVNPPLAPTNTGGAVPQTIYGTVTTPAGGSQGDTDGIGGAASFNNMQGVAVDVYNNVYIADAGNNKIRMITPAGIVTTYAGGGTYGTVDGPALSAAFKKPTGITVDYNGNVYVSQPEDGLIRKIAADGTVSTFAGVAPGGFTDGVLTAARFKNPTGLYAMPNGDIIVVDQGNHAIRKISGNNVTTIAGNGMAGNTDGTGTSAGFNIPASVTADAAGNLYVADFGNQKVRKITPAGVVTTFAGSGTTGNADGQSPVASFNGPFGVAIDGTLNAYVSDENNYTVRRIGNNGTVVIIAGNNVPGTADGVYTSATFTSPQSMVKDYNGNLYIIDNQLNKVRKLVITGYTINRSLPPGLVFDPKTGIITGTPTAQSDPTDYVITAYNAGGSSTFTVNIRVDAIGLAFNSIPAKTTCDVDFDPGASSNFPITYTSDNPAVAIILNGKVHIVAAGTAIITANNGFGQVQQPLIVINPAPPVVTVAASAASTCEGTLITYTATPKKTGYAYQWKVNGVNVGMNANIFSSNQLHNGDQVTCTITDNSQCVPLVSAPSTPLTAVVVSKAAMQISIASSVTAAVCPGTPITFTSTIKNVPDKPVYQWMVNGVDINVNLAALTYSQFRDGDQVTCTITSAGTCLISQSVSSNAVPIAILSESECTVKIPNTFTPNGDGVNDTWNLNLPSGYYGALVSVFNRHGAAVYQSNGYGTPWNGTSKGKPLPAGTYYYIIQPHGTAQRQSGTVVILR